MPDDLDNDICSKKWEWSKLHGGISLRKVDGEEVQSDDVAHPANRLSAIESLCLGRCHNCCLIAPDTVLLMFGAARAHPNATNTAGKTAGRLRNTNGVLGYNLRTDTYFRPRVSGPLPLPRFSGIASFLDTEGYIFVQGGFNSSTSCAVQDITVLDVAPYLNRDFVSLRMEL